MLSIWSWVKDGFSLLELIEDEEDGMDDEGTESVWEESLIELLDEDSVVGVSGFDDDKTAGESPSVVVCNSTSERWWWKMWIRSNKDNKNRQNKIPFKLKSIYINEQWRSTDDQLTFDSFGTSSTATVVGVELIEVNWDMSMFNIPSIIDESTGYLLTTAGYRFWSFQSWKQSEEHKNISSFSGSIFSSSVRNDFPHKLWTDFLEMIQKKKWKKIDKKPELFQQENNNNKTEKIGKQKNKKKNYIHWLYKTFK